MIFIVAETMHLKLHGRMHIHSEKIQGSCVAERGTPPEEGMSRLKIFHCFEELCVRRLGVFLVQNFLRFFRLYCNYSFAIFDRSLAILEYTGQSAT